MTSATAPNKPTTSPRLPGRARVSRAASPSSSRLQPTVSSLSPRSPVSVSHFSFCILHCWGLPGPATPLWQTPSNSVAEFDSLPQNPHFFSGFWPPRPWQTLQSKGPANHLSSVTYGARNIPMAERAGNSLHPRIPHFSALPERQNSVQWSISRRPPRVVRPGRPVEGPGPVAGPGSRANPSGRPPRSRRCSASARSYGPSTSHRPRRTGTTQSRSDSPS